MWDRRKAFTLVEIMIVVALLGILISIVIPTFVRARELARATTCQENLIKIDSAVDQYALEFSKPNGDTIGWSELIGQLKYLKKTPRCRGGGVYTGNGTPGVFLVGSAPTCDYTLPAWVSASDPKYVHAVTAPPAQSGQ